MISIYVISNNCNALRAVFFRSWYIYEISVQPLCERVVACKFFLGVVFFALSSQEKERRFVSDKGKAPNVVALGAW